MSEGADETTGFTYVPSSVSIGDNRGERSPMEELHDVEGLLGVWGAEGDTVQGE